MRFKAPSASSQTAIASVKKAAIWLSLASALLLPMETLQAAELTINGVSGKIAKNIRLTVGDIAEFPEDSSARVAQTAADKASNALGAIGYFSHEIQPRYSLDESGQRITLDIDLGDPTLIRTVTPLINGPAREDAGYMPVISKLPLQRNAVFNSNDYESAKNILIDAAQDRGYFDFRFTTQSVKVSRADLAADITLEAQSGTRYSFGPVTFIQDTFSEEFLKRWLIFKEGDPYESGKIATLTTNLQASGYFSSVRVIPQREDKYGTTVPIHIELTDRDDNYLSVGVGYATDNTKFRTSFTWEKPRLNRFGHSAELGLGFSKVKQNASVSYKIPRKVNPLENYWTIELGRQREVDKPKAIESLLTTWQVKRARKYTGDWLETLYLRWEGEISTKGSSTDETNLLLPGIGFTRVRSEGRPFITKGHSTNYQLFYGSKDFYSSIDLVKATADVKYIKEIAKRNTLIYTLKLGTVASNDYSRVPVSQRFFAGGDRSVRGYSYRDLSPVKLDIDPLSDTHNEYVPVGGRHLQVFGLEYNYRFSDYWSVATFVDTGRAYDDPATRFSTGVGVGIRWQSPVGPFRLDVAIPVNDDEHDKPRFHLSLGPEL